MAMRRRRRGSARALAIKNKLNPGASKAFKTSSVRKRAATTGGSSSAGTGPTPATTPRGGSAGKSAMAASRTGTPPAHGARRKPTLPKGLQRPAGSGPKSMPPTTSRIERGGPGGVSSPKPVSSAMPSGIKKRSGSAYSGTPKLNGAKKRRSY